MMRYLSQPLPSRLEAIAIETINQLQKSANPSHFNPHQRFDHGHISGPFLHLLRVAQDAATAGTGTMIYIGVGS
jgi:hypothetical protein